MSRSTLHLLAALALALPCAAQAGKARIISTDTEAGRSYAMTLEYGGGMARMDLPEQAGGYAVYRDGGAYMVTQQAGFPVVLDLKSMARQLGRMGPQAPSVPGYGEIGRYEDLKPTGHSETVTGIKGDVYLLSWTDSSGTKASEEVVLTSDPRVRELAQILETVARSMAEVTPATHREGQERFMAAIKGKNLAVLRYGKQMRVESLDATAVPASRFELPAEPMQLPVFGDFGQ